MGIAGKRLVVRHIPGPHGVRGRNSDNRLIQSGWLETHPPADGGPAQHLPLDQGPSCRVAAGRLTEAGQLITAPGMMRDMLGMSCRPRASRKVLLSSQRRIADLVAYCLAYEFEDTFAAVTDAQRIDATNLPTMEFSRRAYRLARFVSGSPRLARRLAPYPGARWYWSASSNSFFRHSAPPTNCIRSRLFATGASAATRRPASSPKSGRICCRNICSSSYLPDPSFLGKVTVSRTWRGSPVDRAPTCRSRLTCCVSRLHRSISRARSMSGNPGRRSPVTHQALLQGGRAAAELLLLRHRGCEWRQHQADLLSFASPYLCLVQSRTRSFSLSAPEWLGHASVTTSQIYVHLKPIFLLSRAVIVSMRCLRERPSLSRRQTTRRSCLDVTRASSSGARLWRLMRRQ